MSEETFEELSVEEFDNLIEILSREVRNNEDDF